MLIIEKIKNFKNINNLVIGGAGFIGSHLIDKLISEGENVLCIDNLSTGNISNIRHLKENNKFHFIKYDIINEINSKIPIDKIWHLACPAAPNYYQINPLLTIKVNYQGTLNIVNLAKIWGSKVLFTSTSEVYGKTEKNPQFEDMPINLQTSSTRACYSEGKRIAETLLLASIKQYNLEIRIARIFNTYGSRISKNDGRVISTFINQSLQGKKITIFGDGLQTRSFCFISDLINGLNKLMKSKYSSPINLGNDEEISIFDLACLIRNKINSSISFEYKDLPNDDPQYRKPSLLLAKKYLNWAPIIPLSEGLDSLIDFYKKLEINKSI